MCGSTGDDLDTSCLDESIPSTSSFESETLKRPSTSEQETETPESSKKTKHGFSHVSLTE